MPGDLCTECLRNQDKLSTADTQTVVSLSKCRGAASVDRPTSLPWFFWLALSLGTLAFGCYAFGVWIIVKHGETEKQFGWEYSLRSSRWIVSGVDPLGPAVGRLHKGDQLLAFNEDRRAVQIGPELFIHFLQPGSAYTVRVWRNSREPDITLALKLPTQPPYGATLSRVLVLIPGLIELLLGLFMVLLRPDSALARLGFVWFFMWSVRGLYLTLAPYGGAGLGAATAFIPALWWLSENWNLGLACHFVRRFFANVLKERFWPFLGLLVYAICALFSVVNGVWAAVLFLGDTAATALVSRHLMLLYLRDALTNEFRHGFEAGAIVLGLAALTVGYRRVKDSDQQRRVRWFVFGSIAAVAPFLASVGAFLVWDVWQGTPAGTQQWGDRLDPASHSLILIPIVLTYAVVKHRILGVEVVVRQGVKYLLAQNVLRVILVLPIFGLIQPIVRHPGRPLTDAFRQNTLYVNLVLLIALGASFRYRRQLSAAVDRKFFREAYDQERVLSELIGQIAEIDSLAGISFLVSQQLAATMHPCSICVFYRETARSEMKLRCRSGTGLEMGPALAENSPILLAVRKTRRPLDHSTLDSMELPALERNWLNELGTHFVVPIGLANQPPAGLLALGEKKSEEPYGPAEQKLLQAIAGQMAVVFERLWLREQVEVDRRLQYEVLAHVDAGSINLLKECPSCAACYDHRDEACVHDGNQLTLTLPVPRTIEERYRLDQRIGHGGMGAVFDATDLRLHRKVAVKVLMGRLFGNLAALRRFEREAQASARLTHPNIIAIHDFGRIGEDGAYLVMERLYGSTLRSQLKRNGKIAPAVAAAWFDQLLAGLGAAHEAGVEHRDLKPENVFITPLETGSDRITIVDFGLAKLRLADSVEMESLTMPGAIMGTVGYMSPEQLNGQATDRRSDLFATGVMIFEAITGTAPFRANSYAELVRALSQDRPLVPGDSAAIMRLNHILLKCLAPDCSERFQTASELQRELLPVLRSCPPVI